MRIAINALPARVGAGVTFYRSVLPELAASEGEHEYLLVISEAQREILGEVPEGIVVKAFRYLPDGFALRFLWEQLILPLYLLLWRVELLYSQGNTTTLLAPCRVVTVITGANPYSPMARSAFGGMPRNTTIRLMSRLSVMRSSRVIFISENSARIIGQILGVPEEKRRIVPWSFAPLPAGKSDRLGSVGRYILAVSVLWPHKNIETLLEAFDSLVRSAGYDGSLIVAGAPYMGDHYRHLQRRRSELEHRDRIVFTEEVSPEELGYLYENAEMFVFPSKEETLGLPLLEAMSYGLPIAASDCRLGGRNTYFSPFPEFAADAAVYFDPFDAESMREAMELLLKDPERAAVMGRRGKERVRQYSWKATAAGTISVFDELSRGTGDRHQSRNQDIQENQRS